MSATDSIAAVTHTVSCPQLLAIRKVTVGKEEVPFRTLVLQQVQRQKKSNIDIMCKHATYLLGAVYAKSEEITS